MKYLANSWNQFRKIIKIVWNSRSCYVFEIFWNFEQFWIFWENDFGSKQDVLGSAVISFKTMSEDFSTIMTFGTEKYWVFIKWEVKIEVYLACFQYVTKTLWHVFNKMTAVPKISFAKFSKLSKFQKMTTPMVNCMMICLLFNFGVERFLYLSFLDIWHWKTLGIGDPSHIYVIFPIKRCIIPTI